MAQSPSIEPTVFQEVPLVTEVIPTKTPAPTAVVKPECSLSDAVPANVYRWCHLIDKYAPKRGLDTALVAAVIRHESNGRKNAMSRSGAVGLMQVMPRDGKAASFGVFSGRPTIKQLRDPEKNISYGARILRDCIKRRGGVREGLVCYNPSGGYAYADAIIRDAARYKK